MINLTELSEVLSIYLNNPSDLNSLQVKGRLGSIRTKAYYRHNFVTASRTTEQTVSLTDLSSDNDLLSKVDTTMMDAAFEKLSEPELYAITFFFGDTEIDDDYNSFFSSRGGNAVFHDNLESAVNVIGQVLTSLL